MGKYKYQIMAVGLFSVVMAMQNCSKSSKFSLQDTSQGYQPNTILIGPQVPNTPNPPPTSGLVGKIYYLLNEPAKANPNELGVPTVLLDKNGVEVNFPFAVDSVDFMIERGIQLPNPVRMHQIFIPTTIFSNGFNNISGDHIPDSLDNSIVEAFAFELTGNLILGDNMNPGLHDLALLSDDGATLQADMDGDGSYETMLVDNDGLHATRMGCSSRAIDFQSDTKIPVRLRYYQGPRFHIALNFLMREIDNPSEAGTHPQCGEEPVDPDEWFRTYNGQEPDLTGSSMYGQLIVDGWFLGEHSMFTNDVVAN